MSRSVVRVARVRHRCESCERVIHPGERYRRWVSFPNDGLFDAITACAECSTCAARYERPLEAADV